MTTDEEGLLHWLSQLRHKQKKNLGTWTTNAKYLVFQELSKNFPLMLALQKKFPFLIVLLTK